MLMKTNTLMKSVGFCLISILSMGTHAQTCTNELPSSFSSVHFSVRASDAIELSVPNVTEELHENNLFASADIPYCVGLPIVATNFSLSGYYRQEACTFHDVSHPAISTTDINKATANFVHQGCMVYLTLYGINSKHVSYSGITPDVWYYDGNTQIQFQLPLGSGGIPFYVEVGEDDSSVKQRILFFSVSNNGNISQRE